MRKNSDNDLAHTAADRAKPMNMDSYTHLNQPAHSGLDIERVAAEPVDRGNVEGVAFAHIRQQSAKARSLGSRDKATDIGIVKLLIEIATKLYSLGIDRLIAR
ncbi:hypothetical protein ASE00_16340 [Sphingomonas sp. Root710]|nr:hypothetical protein ASE00_16340 [Sphingomonas sp. Root710]